MSEDKEHHIREGIFHNNVEKFFDAIGEMKESYGGNAGHNADGRSQAGYNFYFYPSTGEIILFTNQHTHPPEHAARGIFVVAEDMNINRLLQKTPLPTEIVKVYIKGEASREFEDGSSHPILQETIKRINRKYRERQEAVLK